MRWCFWVRMEDLRRMEARAVHVLDRLQATIVALSSARIDGNIFLSGVMEAEEKEAIRIEALWRKIEGICSVRVAREMAAMQHVMAQFRILCDMSERAEVLQFINAIHARVLMVRPTWVTFEMTGTPQQIEAIYLSIVGYGIVDIVSCSTALMASAEDAVRELAEVGQ
jgi:acetolactate synthase small subunit